MTTLLLFFLRKSVQLLKSSMIQFCSAENRRQRTIKLEWMAFEKLPNPSKSMRQNIYRQAERSRIKNLKSSVIVFVDICVHCYSYLPLCMNIKVQNPVASCRFLANIFNYLYNQGGLKAGCMLAWILGEGPKQKSKACKQRGFTPKKGRVLTPFLFHVEDL